MTVESELYAKINSLLRTFQDDLRPFLKLKFEATEKADWWDRYVLQSLQDKVEEIQDKTDNLEGLDTNELLRVLSYNWKGSLGLSVNRKPSKGRLDAIVAARELRHSDAHRSKQSSKDWTSVFMYLEGVEYIAKTLPLSKAVLNGVESIRAEIYKLVPPETVQTPDADEPRVTVQKLNLSQYILEASSPPEIISGFVGRDQQLEQITHWALNKKHESMFVFGPPGSGKTSIGGEFIKRIRDHAESNLYIASHFIRSRDIMSHNLADMELSLAAQIGNSVGWSYPSHNSTEKEIRYKLYTAISELDSGEHGEVIFVIDGLDELPVKLQNQATMFLEQWQLQGIRCLVLSRRIEAFKSVIPQIEFAYNDEKNLQDLREAASRKLVDAVESESSRDELLELVLERAQGQWVYLDIMLRGIENGTLDDVAIRKLPQGMKEYYDVTLKKLEEGLGGGEIYRDSVVPCLALLALTPRALSTREIAVIGSIEPRYVADVISKIGELLISSKASSTGNNKKDQVEEEKYELCHQSVREFLGSDKIIGAELTNQGRNLIRAHCSGKPQLDLSREQVTELLEHFGDAEIHLALYGSTSYLSDVPKSKGLDGVRETLDLIPEQVLATEAANSNSFLLAVKSAIASREIQRLTDMAQSKLGLFKLALDKPESSKHILECTQTTPLGYAELIGACTLRSDSESYHIVGNEIDVWGWADPEWSAPIKRCTLASQLALLGGSGFLWYETDDQFKLRIERTLYLGFEGWLSYEKHVKDFELINGFGGEFHRCWEIGIRFERVVALFKLRLSLTEDVSSLCNYLGCLIGVISSTSWLYGWRDALEDIEELISTAYRITSRSRKNRESIDVALEHIANLSVEQKDFKSFVLVLDLMLTTRSNAGAQIIVKDIDWVLEKLSESIDLYIQRFDSQLEKIYDIYEGESELEMEIDQACGYLPVEADVVGSLNTILRHLDRQSEDFDDSARSRVVSLMKPRLEPPMFRSLNLSWDFEKMFKPKTSLPMRIGGADLSEAREYVSGVASNLKGSALASDLDKFILNDCLCAGLTPYIIKEFPDISGLAMLCNRLCYCIDFEDNLSECQRLLTSMAQVGLYGKCEGDFKNIGEEWFDRFFKSFEPFELFAFSGPTVYPYEHDTMDLLLLKTARLDPYFICGLIELLERERNDESGNQNAWPDFIVYLRAALYRTILCLPKHQLEPALQRISKLPDSQEATHTVFPDSENYLQRFFQLSSSELHKVLDDGLNSGDDGLQEMLESLCPEVNKFALRGKLIESVEDILEVLRSECHQC